MYYYVYDTYYDYYGNSTESSNVTVDNSTANSSYSYDYSDYPLDYYFDIYENSTYPYTGIDGIQDYEYNFTQGGYRKFKEPEQNDLA